MPFRPPVVTWVVYERRTPGKPKMTVMCEQSEWDELVLTQRDHCVLVRTGITNEGEAERLARSGAVEVKVKDRPKPVPPGAADAVGPGERETSAMSAFWAHAKRCAAESPANVSSVGG